MTTNVYHGSLQGKIGYPTIVSLPEDSKEYQTSEPNTTTRVFGLDIGRLSKPLQLFVCTFLVFSLFVLYGYCQEWLYITDGFEEFNVYVTVVQFGFYSIFGIIERKVQASEIERKVPLQTYALLAFLTIGTMGLSNTSLKYLNYPTQVIFKSSKLIPVMIGGVIIQGKVYSILDICSCALMTIGLAFFTYADQTVSPNFNVTGIVLICLALCADAAIGNVQEKVMKQHHASNAEMVLYSYGIGFLILCVLHIVYGGVLQFGHFLLKNPKVLHILFIFSLAGYIGIQFVLHLVRTFGALLAVTVTTCRKAVTMVLSFLLFAKPFTMQYVWSGLLVLLGILLNVYSKNKSKIHALFQGSSKRSKDNIV
ncbi:adenosine 3'-phospho 5'-phosphosulfate transporter 2-like [Clavelina lepadiformis]|uniref:adenosine 3'-phospho 5'-phosphosulfate transporter 2-like n=1 Tax=Clavelina lepadiformis TaxID=159417 RepID=UPI0040425E83